MSPHRHGSTGPFARFAHLFSAAATAGRKPRRSRSLAAHRALRLESLESRAMLSSAPFIAELPQDLAGKTASLVTVHGRYGNNALNGDWELGITSNTSAPPQKQIDRIWNSGAREPFTFSFTNTHPDTFTNSLNATFSIGGSGVQFNYGSQFASYEPNAIKIWARTATATSSLTINDLRITTPGVTGKTMFPGASIAVSQASGTVFQEIIIAGIDFQSVSGGTITLEGSVTMQFGTDPALRGSALQFHVIATHIPWVDLDVDSNNNGTIDLTNGRRGTDDRIEQSAPGKIIPVGGARAEMLVTVPAGRNATLEIDAAAADKIRVHTHPDQNTSFTLTRTAPNSPATLDLALVPPTNSTPTLKTWRLWVEAVAPSTTAGDIVLTLTGDQYGPPVRDIVRATAVEANLVAHRTGDFFGQPLSKLQEDRRDPNEFIVLTNNDFDAAALVPDDDAADDEALDLMGIAPNIDDDLMRVTLKRLPLGLPAGLFTYQIVLSDPRAVRLFRDDGSLLYVHRDADDPAYDVRVNSPAALWAVVGAPGAFEFLAARDVDIRVEALTPVPSFSFDIIASLATNARVIGMDGFTSRFAKIDIRAQSLLSGSSRGFLYYAYFYKAYGMQDYLNDAAFSSTATNASLIADDSTDAGTTALAPLTASAANPDPYADDDVWAKQTVAHSRVFADTTADDGYGDALLSYYRAYTGGYGQFLLDTFLNQQTNLNNRQNYNHQILVANLRQGWWRNLPVVGATDAVLNTYAPPRDKGGPNRITITIHSGLNPATAGQLLAEKMEAIAATDGRFIRGLKDAVLARLDRDPQDPAWETYLAEYKKLLTASYNAAADAAKGYAEIYYRSVALVSAGADLVITMHDLAQGDMSAIIGGIPIVGRTAASTFGRFRMRVGAWVSNIADVTVCRVFRQGCFDGDTTVLTESGSRAIRDVGPGTRVWAYDTAENRWFLNEVVAAHAIPWMGTMVRLDLGTGSVLATDQHPVWVVTGADRGARPAVAELPADEQGLTEDGRWVAAIHVRAGDTVLLADGSTAVVAAVATDYREQTVYTLTVANAHTFAVGDMGLLVHNGPACTPAQFEAIRESWQQFMNCRYIDTPQGRRLIYVIDGRAYNWQRGLSTTVVFS